MRRCPDGAGNRRFYFGAACFPTTRARAGQLAPVSRSPSVRQFLIQPNCRRDLDAAGARRDVKLFAVVSRRSPGRPGRADDGAELIEMARGRQGGRKPVVTDEIWMVSGVFCSPLWTKN